MTATLLVAVATGVGCTRSGATLGVSPGPGSGVAFEVRSWARSSGECGDNGAPCIRLAFTWPEAASGPDSSAVGAINAHIRELMERPAFGDGGSAEQLFGELDRSRASVVEEFPDYGLPWWIERTATVERNDHRVFAIALYQESYGGGAHGAHSLQFLNLRPETGGVLTLADVLVDGAYEELEAVAEATFRLQLGLSSDASLDEAGFWFDDGTFDLTDNVLIGNDGLRFRYNEYEIRAYAFGPTDLLIPYADIEHLLLPGVAPRE